MSEQTDNTTERDESSSPESNQKPHSYYDDDSTGYEVYDPAQEDEDEDEKNAESNEDEA